MPPKDMDGRIGLLLLIDDLEYGGAQRQVIELANGLDSAHFEVHVCCLSDYLPMAGSLVDRSRLHVIRKHVRFDASVIPRLARLLRRLRIDIVHTFLFQCEIAGRLAGRLVHTRIVINSERNANYPITRRQLIAYRLTRGCADLIVANSSAGAAYHRSKLRHDASQYRVVYNGVDTGRFVPGDGRALRASLGIEPDERVAGMFASFWRQKNHRMFFDAARRVLDRLPRSRFVLVGDELHAGMHGTSAYKRLMMAHVDSLGIRDRCLFLGNRTDVEQLYRVCDVTVLPSLNEGMANVLLESMASGVPVVATDIADNARIVPDGRVGYVVPVADTSLLADRIACLLADESLRERMGRQARAWMTEEFTVASMVERMARVYDAALAAHRKGTGA